MVYLQSILYYILSSLYLFKYVLVCIIVKSQQRGRSSLGVGFEGLRLRV